HAFVSGKIGKCDAGAKARAAVDVKLLERIKVPQAQQRFWDLLAPLHVRKKVGAAGDGHGAWAFSGKTARGFLDGARSAELEKRQPHHGCVTFMDAPRCG